MAPRATVEEIAEFEHRFFVLGQSHKMAAEAVGKTESWGRKTAARIPVKGKYLPDDGDGFDIHAGPKKLDELRDIDRRALDDFGLFRARFFGRLSLPWAEQAAYEIEERLVSAQKEYVVLNVNPGSGKTTLLHDICAWQTAKRRGIRSIWGSSTHSLATNGTRRLRATLDRSTPLRARDTDRENGYAKDAEAVLADAYGRFKPLQGLWRAEMFTVWQHGEDVGDDKEASWQAYGQDSEQLGTRVDLIVWDDLVTRKTLTNQDIIEAQQWWYDNEAETRLEPAGLLVLCGQRLAANDLYRYCVSADAITQTARGAVPMRDVRVGDRVLTREGYRDVEWSGSTGWKPTVTIETTSGLSLALTGDHQVSTPSGWVRADALTPGCDLHVIRPPLSLPPLIAGLPVGVAAHLAPSMPLGVEVGALRRVGMTSAATVACSEPTHSFASPHVPTMVLADEMVGAHAGGVPAQVRGFSALRNRATVEVVMADHHPSHQLLTRVRPGGGGAVSSEVLGPLPDEAFPFELGSGGKPLVGERLSGASSVAVSAPGGLATDGLPAVDTVRSITHTSTIEVWDLTVNKTHEFYANGILVHNCLDKLVDLDSEVELDDEMEQRLAESRRHQYHHIVFRAHDDENCEGHNKGTKQEAWPNGCLLDPYRLPWRQVLIEKRDPHRWEVVFQQNDTAGVNTLVQRQWIDGGFDLKTRVEHPGCWDQDRAILELPDPEKWPGKIISYVSVDPSVSNWWGFLWWIYHPASQQRFLIDIKRVKMLAGGFLQEGPNGEFEGIVPEWQRRSAAMEAPITRWVVEANAAHKYLTGYGFVQRFEREHRTKFISHTTGSNKADPKYGIGTLGALYQHGLKRLPGLSKQTVKPLINELLAYPDSATSDLVMADWIGEFNLQYVIASEAFQPYVRKKGIGRRLAGHFAGIAP